MTMPKVGIVGAGPAGIACAVQLSRYGFNPLVFEAKDIGGLLRNANLVENYPGFPAGISGPSLVKLFMKQLENHEHLLVSEEVEAIAWWNGGFDLKTNKFSPPKTAAGVFEIGMGKTS